MNGNTPLPDFFCNCHRKIIFEIVFEIVLTWLKI